jgi:hypothetical protein
MERQREQSENEMIIWRITGDEIGPHGNGAYFFATKAEAEKAKREFLSDPENRDKFGDGPDKITILTRDQLANELNDAMGYGAS